MSQLIGEFPLDPYGSFITAEWYPDPRVIQEELLRLAVDLEDWEAPMVASREVLMEATRRRFATETDPYGDPWQELDENTIKRETKMRIQGGILVLTGDMEAYATSQEAWLISERTIVFNEEGLPGADSDGKPYGVFHQLGTEGGPARGLYESSLGFGPLTQEQTTSLEGGLRGRNLPQRMFIGVDEESVDEIYDIFGTWLDTRIAEDLPPLPAYNEFAPMGMGSNRLGFEPIIGFLPTGQPRLKSGRFGFKL